MEKKTAPIDRLQAIIRKPEYIKEYSEFSKLELFDPDYKIREEELLKRWGLKALTDPAKIPVDFGEPQFYIDEYIVKTVFHKTGSNKITGLKDKRYLTVKIDLTYTNEQIMKELEMFIMDYRPIAIKLGNGRNRELQYNIWAVYSKHVNEKLSFTQIAREHTKLKGRPADNEILMASYLAVKRAYKKACDLIKTVK